MSNKEIIDDILRREGGSKKTNDPKDGGGRTQYGIAERSNPKAWADGKVTEEEARAIYEQKYIIAPGFNKIPHPKLQAQLVDFGVNSGPRVAIEKLQAIVGADVDGEIGPQTLAAVETFYKDVDDPARLNNLLVVERVKMIGRIVVRNPSQVKFLSGWLNRAFEFLIP